jgi:hypothetical protein
VRCCITVITVDGCGFLQLEITAMARRRVNYTHPSKSSENRAVAQSGPRRGRAELQPPRTGRSNWIRELPFEPRVRACQVLSALDHIQHTCEVLSAAHIDTHHQCWRLIHGELARLAAPTWKFLCFSGEKCLQTLRNEIPIRIKGLQYLNLTQDTIWNAERTREMDCPLTQAQARRVQEGQSKEEIAKERFWRMRADGIAVLPPMGNKAGVFCILEHKRMSNVCDCYLTRAKLTAEKQYASLRSAMSEAIQRSKVPEASIQSIHSKLTMTVFLNYANILKCMYSTRFSGGSTRLEPSPEAQSTPIAVTPLIRTIDTSRPDRHKRRRKESQETKDK